jgi:hypothetical protein
VERAAGARQLVEQKTKRGTTMIICSKHEGNGTYREFVLDDTQLSTNVHVRTYLAQPDQAVSDNDWTDAGVITRVPDGLRASVRRRFQAGFTNLDDVFPNEIAALQAIALSFESSDQGSQH